MYKKAVLIADDIEMNREILAMTFEEEYEVIQAENGEQVLQQLEKCGECVQAILLDLVMPVMDGFTVLNKLREMGILEKIPVFLITAENDQKMLSKAYEMGVVDIVNKPFVPELIRKRIRNVLELFNARKQLSDQVHIQKHALEEQARQLRAQAQKLQQLNSSIIDTLATVIEFRDCESGEHVKRIRSLTVDILEKLCENFPEYGVLREEIPLIGEAAVMHDVGKIAIPDPILNKPGKLTSEEFEIMKLHTVRGCEMLQQIPQIAGSGLSQYCYDICRYHHERWSGKGYPDGLKGDEIPIWAQVVSIADVYDALISPRVYKKAFSREKTVAMICAGECGELNPKLLECFLQAEEEIYTKWYKDQGPDQLMMSPLQWNVSGEEHAKEVKNQLEWEAQRADWLMQQVQTEMMFFYNIGQDYIEYTKAYSECFGENGKQFHAKDAIKNDKNISEEEKECILQELYQLTPVHSCHTTQVNLKTLHGQRLFDLQIQAFWNSEQKLVGCIGKMHKK